MEVELGVSLEFLNLLSPNVTYSIRAQRLGVRWPGTAFSVRHFNGSGGRRSNCVREVRCQGGVEPPQSKAGFARNRRPRS